VLGERVISEIQLMQSQANVPVLSL